MDFLDGDQFDPADPRPGLYLGVHEETYHSCTAAVSKHMLDEMVVPARLKYEIDHPEERGEPTPALIMGSLVDTLVFEPDEYPARFVVIPEGISARKKAGQEMSDKQAFIERARRLGKQVISKDDQQMAAKLKRGIYNNPRAAILLENGYPQPVIVWHDRFTDIKCKGRLDYYNELENVIVDLKTAASATRGAFGKAATNFRYHVQDQFYREGWRETTGQAVEDFKFVVVEKIPPYCCAVRHLDLPARARGHELWRRDLTKYAGCVVHDEWPGYPDASISQDLPRFAYYDED